MNTAPAIDSATGFYAMRRQHGLPTVYLAAVRFTSERDAMLVITTSVETAQRFDHASQAAAAARIAAGMVGGVWDYLMVRYPVEGSEPPR